MLNVRMARLIILVSILLAQSAFAWGDKGHEVVIRLALEKLTTAQQEKLFDIVGTRDPHVIGHWADSVRDSKDPAVKKVGTGPWHYVDIPKWRATYDADSDCTPTCIIEQLAHFQSVITDPTGSKQDRKEALLFFLHFMGDLHQPFHCYDDHDRGGNDIAVTFNGMPTNLHKLWDSDIIESQHLTAQQLTELLLPHVKPPTHLIVKTLIKNYIAWANQTHPFAGAFCLPNNAVVDSQYTARAWRRIQTQLALAGERTAAMLRKLL